jgi:hypothetical protein
MEIEKKKVIGSKLFEELDVPSIYEYGEVTFGEKLADIFYFDVIDSVRLLETH